VRVTFCGNVWWVAHAILICDDDPEIRGAMIRAARGTRYRVTPTRFGFLVTGNRDIEIAARTVNEGAVQRSFSRPWNDEKLGAALEIVPRVRRSVVPGGG